MGAPRKVVGAVALLAIVVAAGAWVLSAPERLDAETVAVASNGDAVRGEGIFFAAGCASCHSGSEATGDERFQLTGGTRLETAFGTFVAPNISQHPEDGIGRWSAEDFANAMMRGVTPGGSHIYPAFPYTSYARMTPQDVGDLYAFLKTTPAVGGSAGENDVAFPFNIRRGLGLWKRLYLDPAPVVALSADASEAVRRGQYLVEGPGHCGECHTPRDAFGGPDRFAWLAGAPSVEGEGNVPNITPGGLDWSESEIAEYLSSGFTPDFDSAGGAMADVIENLAELDPADRTAIAAYLKAIPAHENGASDAN